MAARLAPVQWTVLRSILGLLQALVIGPETKAISLDRCLAHISELPIIHSVLGEEDVNADGRKSEVSLADSGTWCTMEYGS